jgi:hypothetical protein
VTAALPSVGKTAAFELNRGGGLSAGQLEQWRTLIEGGVTDETLAQWNASQGAQESQSRSASSENEATSVTPDSNSSTKARETNLPPGEKPKKLTEAHLIPKLVTAQVQTQDQSASEANSESDWKSRRKKIQPG